MLEPKNIRLVWKDDGIQIEIDGSSQQVGRIVRAFPKTNPNQYVGFLASDGQEIGLLKNPNELDIISSKLLCFCNMEGSKMQISIELLLFLQLGELIGANKLIITVLLATRSAQKCK